MLTTSNLHILAIRKALKFVDTNRSKVTVGA